MSIARLDWFLRRTLRGNFGGLGRMRDNGFQADIRIESLFHRRTPSESEKDTGEYEPSEQVTSHQRTESPVVLTELLA